MSKKCYHEEKGTNVNEMHNKKPDLNCTCDVGATGPAADPSLTAKSHAPLLHPETPAATGPAKEIEEKDKLLHPQTPAPTGPAK